MKNKNLIPITLYMFSFFLLSCNSEFSKYKKVDKNDLEESHLLGNVKSVTRYYDGELADIHRYNKYGFETEYVDYSDGEVVEKRNYTYNEFGKITRIETIDKNCHKADMTIFDEYGNAVEESEEIYEVFNTNSDVTVGKRLNYTYENKYDKLGGFLSRKCLRRDGTCLYEEKYNQNGQLSKRIEYDEDGSVYKYTDYSYSGNVLEEQKETFPDSHVRYCISSYNQYGDLVKRALLYEDGSFETIKEFILDHNRYLIKEIETNVVSYPWREDLKPGDIVHFVTIYDNDEHGYTLKETKLAYYPNEDMSIPKEADEVKNYQYKYDSHGNMIYSKGNDGLESKYEITYY